MKKSAAQLGMKTGMKTCTRCRAAEWPCFLVDDLCRMCQAQLRDVKRVSKENP